MASLRPRDKRVVRWQNTAKMHRIVGFVICTVLLLLVIDLSLMRTINESKVDQQQVWHKKGGGQPTSIVVQLHDDMGNDLSYLAYGRAIQLWAERQYGIETELVLRQTPVWNDPIVRAKKCFPTLRPLNFSLASGPEFDDRLVQQRKWLGDSESKKLELRTTRFEEIDQGLSTLKQLLMAGTKERDNGLVNNDKLSRITMPFLYVEFQVMYDAVVDKFYEDFREFYKFDYRACCGWAKPYRDETVFHIRNYATEIGNAKEIGYEELDANRTARNLFGNLGHGDKIAITSKYSSSSSIDPYVDALKARGIKVRVMQKQSAMEDFCFMMRAKKEMVGVGYSTFAMWAGYLGNAQKVRLYNVDSPSRRGEKSQLRNNVHHHYNWTNRKLKSKVFFELHKIDFKE